MGRTRVRTGPLFKRGGNRDYARHRNRLEVPFARIFSAEPTGAKMLRLSVDLGIPHATLYRWRDKWRSDPEWRPWNTKKKEEHRIFTDAEEIAISDFIVKNSLGAWSEFGDHVVVELGLSLGIMLSWSLV